MSELSQRSEEPFVGFFPCFYSMGETIPIVKIAKSYMERGGRAIFFSHGGAYEYLAKDIGCNVINLNDILKGLTDKGKHMFKQGGNLARNLTKLYTANIVRKSVDQEVKAFEKSNIRLLVSSFNLTTSVSARAMGIPLVTVVSGVTIPPYYQSGGITFSDNYENYLTKLIPSLIKDQAMRWFLLHNKILVRAFNKTAKEYNVSKFNYFNDLIQGDHSFVCDDIHFLGISPTKKFPSENFIGPIMGGGMFAKNNKPMDQTIESHLKKPGRSIVLIMGSTGVKQLFLEMVHTLSKTKYNTIAVYTNLLDKENLPKTDDKILFKKFVPMSHIMKDVDLAITHGGRGTIYQIAYSGKPAICIPMFLEHQGNIENLVRHGSAIKLSKSLFNRNDLLDAIRKIFNNYDYYKKNAERLQKLLQKEPGQERAAKRIVDILKSYQ